MQTIQLISLRHSAFYTPYLITFVGDFLKQQGLNAKYTCVNSVDELETALITGTAHVAQSAVGVSMRQVGHGLDITSKATSANHIKHFAQINQRDGFFIAASPDYILGKGSIKTFNWHALENSRIIADHLFQPIATLKSVLDKKGVDVEKIDFINIGDAQLSKKAFLAGEADFLHLQGPYPQQLEVEGKAKIVASVGEALGEIAYSSLCATNEWLTTPMASSFMKAYKTALEYVQKTDPSQLASQLVSQFEDIDLKTLAETIRAYKNMESWSSEACISESAFESANQVFLFSGDIPSAVDYENIISRELCQ